MSVFVPGDTPAASSQPKRELSHIVVTWSIVGSQDGHALYDAFTLGEGQARQRAAARVAIVKNNHDASNIRRRDFYMDGRIEETRS